MIGSRNRPWASVLALAKEPYSNWPSSLVGARVRQHHDPRRRLALGRLDPPGDRLGRAHLDGLEEGPLVELLILPDHAQGVAEPARVA